MINAKTSRASMSSAKTSDSNVRWLLVFWLFVLSAVSYLDRVNISIAGGSIAEAYHLSDVQLGQVFSAMLVGYALFQTVGGRLADRFGPRRVLAAGVAWWGIFTALTAMVPADIAGALVIFMAVRFLLGAGEAVIYPSANQFIARWIPTTERGIANGWIFAGVGAGAGLTPLIVITSWSITAGDRRFGCAPSLDSLPLRFGFLSLAILPLTIPAFLPRNWR